MTTVFLLRALCLSIAASVTTASTISWSHARSQADALISVMNSTEKQNVTYGFAGASCSGQTGSITRLGVPGFCFQDAENGVRGAGFVNAYAAGISVAASWNVGLAHTRGSFMGAEFKRKGNHAVNGPVVGPMGRLAEDGRAFEGFGSDPYLAGKLAASTVQGLQENVIAVVKHYIFNEQEIYRNPLGNKSAVSSNVDDATAHELYLWPFQDAVQADAAGIMCSYQRINGTYASQNEKALTQWLKQELAFPGFVVSDWGAQHAGVESAAAGLDVAMPNSDGFWKDNLQDFVNNGSLTQARFDDMVSRVLTSWYKVIGCLNSSFPEPGVGMFIELDKPHPLIDARDPASKPTILQGAIEGHVLVKNTNNALPLRKPKLLSLYGYDAIISQRYNPVNLVSVDANYSYGLESTNISLDLALEVLSGQYPTDLPSVAPNGLLWNGLGSGANNPSAVSDIYGAIQRRARADDTYLYWDFQNQDPTINPLSEACLVFLNQLSSEGVDRTPGLNDADSDALVSNVANKCENTVVVIHNPAIRTVDAWVDHPNVTALIYAHYPGNDAGESLASILYGEVSPSGRLPYTVARNQSSYGSLLGPILTNDTHPQANFTEGIYTDYRYFLKEAREFRYAFGYGLTYTTFNYSRFFASWVGGISPSDLPTFPTNTTVAPGGIVTLWECLAHAYVDITNTGNVAAAEVPQLYIHFPGEQNQVHFLRGFDKIHLQPNQTRTVQFDLTRRDLSRWDVVSQQWRLFDGTIELRIGKSAEEILYTAMLPR